MIGRMETSVSRLLSSGGRCVRGGVFLAAASILLSGCGYFVQSSRYEKDTKASSAKVEFIRKQLLAHTQILQNHGRSINEVQLQLRDIASSVKKQREFAPARSPAKSKKFSRAMPKSAKMGARSGRRLMGGHPIGKSLFVRASYRGLPLNYAGGYRKPGGKRFPYKLPPGTLVEVLSTDNRGFTRILVKSGRWKKRKMWVRTRWLVVKMKSRKRKKG